MEILTSGLAEIGSAIGAIAGWAGFTAVAGIAAVTFLIYTNKISAEKVEDFFFNRKKKY